VITNLSLANFKSWKLIKDMRLAPITCLFGTNSSGKTSILQLLLLLKQTVDSADRNIALDLGDNRALVSLGTLADVLHDHDTTKPMSWSLTWDPEFTVRPTGQGPVFMQGYPLRFQASIALSELREPVVTNLLYGFREAQLGMRRSGNGDYELELAPDTEFAARLSPGTVPGPVKSYGFPSEVSTRLQGSEFLSDYALQYEHLFDKIHYLGPLRVSPERQYFWAGGIPADVGTRGERAVDAMLAKGLVGDTSFHIGVASVLRDLGLIHDFAVREVAPGSSIYEVRVRQSEESAEVLLPDVGFGVSQILPVIVLCYYVRPGSIILLEQPEMHLHPKAQAALADVLIDAMKVNKLQIIVESHSEHLLQRLQRRIAEQVLAPSDVALYFCDQVEGASRLTPLDVNTAGGITNWPDGFFGDPLGEAVAMTKAAQEQRA
jgi:hypothetical protein